MCVSKVKMTVSDLRKFGDEVTAVCLEFENKKDTIIYKKDCDQKYWKSLIKWFKENKQCKK